MATPTLWRTRLMFLGIATALIAVELALLFFQAVFALAWAIRGVAFLVIGLIVVAYFRYGATPRGPGERPESPG